MQIFRRVAPARSSTDDDRVDNFAPASPFSDPTLDFNLFLPWGMCHQRDQGEEPSKIQRMRSRFWPSFRPKLLARSATVCSRCCWLATLNELYSPVTVLVRLWPQSQCVVIRIIGAIAILPKALTGGLLPVLQWSCRPSLEIPANTLPENALRPHAIGDFNLALPTLG